MADAGGRDVSAARAAEVERRFRAGERHADIAAATGLSPGGVNNLCIIARRAGRIGKRPPGVARPADLLPRVAQLRRDGLSRHEIARATGYGVGGVAKLVWLARKSGLDVAPPPKPPKQKPPPPPKKSGEGDPDESWADGLRAADDAACEALAGEFPGLVYPDFALACVRLCLLLGALRMAAPGAAALIRREIRDRGFQTFSPPGAACGSPGALCAEGAIAGERPSDMRETPLFSTR